MTKKPHHLIPQVLAAGLTLFGAAGCSPVYFSQGLAGANQGHFKGAVADYNPNIDFNANNAIAYRWSDIQYKREKKEDWSTDNYYKLGFFILCGLIGLAVYYNHDTAAETYLNQGNANYKQGKIEEAISDYNQALDLDPKLAIAYNNRGKAKYAVGKKAEAISDYNQALDLNPKLAAGYKNRGLAKSGLGRIEEALADYNQAIDIDPNDADAYNNRGKVKYELGEKEEARADFVKANNLNPELAVAYYVQGLAKYGRGKIEEAISDYNQAIDLDPKRLFRTCGDNFI
ncbi:tetratricopeptide repeat protein [Microcoleus sp. Pol11C3]|uniref:tetratricopeptide repeat protein n=1 Tax=Microcoleus sp. Pol11C3 TaxID=3055390 RepID=UPI002FD0381D